jgi:hypothetical protein
MLTATQEGDAIFSRAIEIASPEERAAYIAQACGADAALKLQIEERVAAHFRACNGSAPPRKGEAAEAAGVPQASRHESSAPKTQPPQNEPRKSSSLLLRVTTVLLVAAAVAGVALAIWAVRAQGEAQKAMRQAAEEQERVRKIEENSQHQREEAKTARQEVAKARDQAVEEEKAAQSTAEDMKAVVDFWQRRVLSSGRPAGALSAGQPVGWTGGLGKNVMLRQAVDQAEPRTAEAFANRPLAEASIREIFASSYLDLEEWGRAVAQYERALALHEALQGANHSDTMACRNQLAYAYRLADRPDDAGLLFDKDQHSSTHAAALAIRGAMLLAHKKPAEAEKVLRECLAIRTKLQPDDWTTFDAKSLLGEALLEQKKYADAEPLLLSGYEGLKKHQAKIPAADKLHLTTALERLVHVYEATAKSDKAVAWRKELDKARDSKHP